MFSKYNLGIKTFLSTYYMNQTQQKTLEDILNESVRMLLRVPLGNIFLSEVIEPIKLTQDMALDILKKNRNLIVGTSEEITNIPLDIRADWLAFERAFAAGTSIPSDLWKKLEKYPNFNPVCIAEMQRFEDTLKYREENIRMGLLRLRELYLEMTPKHEYTYGNGHGTFYFRIGTVPLNLDQFGDKLLAGEIRDKVRRQIEASLEAHLEYQEEKTKAVDAVRHMTTDELKRLDESLTEAEDVKIIWLPTFKERMRARIVALENELKKDFGYVTDATNSGRCKTTHLIFASIQILKVAIENPNISCTQINVVFKREIKKMTGLSFSSKQQKQQQRANIFLKHCEKATSDFFIQLVEIKVYLSSQ